jgi:hypothetical protein
LHQANFGLPKRGDGRSIRNIDMDVFKAALRAAHHEEVEKISARGTHRPFQDTFALLSNKNKASRIKTDAMDKIPEMSIDKHPLEYLQR